MKGFTAYPVDITFYRYFVQNIKDANGVPNKTMSDIRDAQSYYVCYGHKGNS